MFTKGARRSARHICNPARLIAGLKKEAKRRHRRRIRNLCLKWAEVDHENLDWGFLPREIIDGRDVT